MDEDEGWIFYGHGSMHELNDRDEPHQPRPRLEGLKSVSKAAMWAMHQEAPAKRQRRNRVGFAIPRRAR